MFLNSQSNENGISPAKKLLKRELRTNLTSVKLLFPQNSVATETPRPILFQIFHKKIPLGFVLMSKIFGTKRPLS